MNLATEFIAILKEYGHSVYVQRRRDENESGPYRTVAGGRYEPVAEKWTAYRWFPSTKMNVRNERLAQFGLFDGIEGIFYFETRSMLKTGDLISEDTPKERTRRDLYRIEKAVPYYLGNEMIYIAAHVKKIEPIA